MGRLSRRERRQFAALAEQLARDDAELAELLSRPVEPARHPIAVVVGQVLFLVGLLVLAWGCVMSARTAVTIGAIVLLTCWVPWCYGLDTAR